MTMESGRVPSGQALAVPVEPVSRLDPTGFDPSREGDPAPTMIRSWITSMTKQGEDRIWRGAERALAELDGMESQLTYLRAHHEETETMLGIVSLSVGPELMGKLRPYSDRLELLWINRLLDIGVPASSIGQRATFNADDRLVAIAMEARQGGDGETRLDPKDDSAGPQDIAQGGDAWPSPSGQLKNVS